MTLCSSCQTRLNQGSWSEFHSCLTSRMLHSSLTEHPWRGASFKAWAEWPIRLVFKVLNDPTTGRGRWPTPGGHFICVLLAGVINDPWLRSDIYPGSRMDATHSGIIVDHGHKEWKKGTFQHPVIANLYRGISRYRYSSFTNRDAIFCGHSFPPKLPTNSHLVHCSSHLSGSLHRP